MKLVIEKAPLLRVLGHLQGVVERRSTIPILSNLLMVAEDDTLALSSTDMDIELVVSLPSAVDKPGRLTAGASALHDIVRKLRDGSQIDLEQDEKNLRLAVRSGRSVFNIPTLPHEDYPKMSAGDLPHSFSVPAGDLRRLIDATRFAISTEETRYYLNGIYLHPAVNDERVGVLRAVTTDGHRMARFDLPLPDGAREMQGVIVPRKTVTELRKLIDGAGKDDEVVIRASDTKIEFKTGSATMVSKVIDGTFPDYSRVIPLGNDKIIGVARKDVSEAVDRVAIIETGRSRSVKFDFTAGSLELSAMNSEMGAAVEGVDVRYTGAQLHVGFNARYFLDIAGQIAGDEIEFRLADGGSPAVVVDPADKAALYVLMPVRM